MVVPEYGFFHSTAGRPHPHASCGRAWHAAEQEVPDYYPASRCRLEDKGCRRKTRQLFRRRARHTHHYAWTAPRGRAQAEPGTRSGASFGRRNGRGERDFRTAAHAGGPSPPLAHVTPPQTTIAHPSPQLWGSRRGTHLEWVAPEPAMARAHQPISGTSPSAAPSSPVASPPARHHPTIGAT
jgi:hypothetical protein